MKVSAVASISSDVSLCWSQLPDPSPYLLPYSVPLCPTVPFSIPLSVFSSTTLSILSLYLSRFPSLYLPPFLPL